MNTDEQTPLSLKNARGRMPELIAALAAAGETALAERFLKLYTKREELRALSAPATLKKGEMWRYSPQDAARDFVQTNNDIFSDLDTNEATVLKALEKHNAK